jgi:hypothetical protein
MDEEKQAQTKLAQVQFHLQFMTLCNAAGRLDDMNKSFLLAGKLVNELVEEEKEQNDG